MRAGFFVFLVLVASACYGLDWHRCTLALQDLQVVAESSEEVSRKAEGATADLERARESLSICRAYSRPEDCTHERDEVESAEDEHRIAIDTAQTELLTLSLDIESMGRYCYLSPPPRAKSDRALSKCDELKRVRPSFSPESLRSICASIMSPAECQKCLAE
jgi:hypothetical protein